MKLCQRIETKDDPCETGSKFKIDHLQGLKRTVFKNVVVTIPVSIWFKFVRLSAQCRTFPEGIIGPRPYITTALGRETHIQDDGNERSYLFFYGGGTVNHFTVYSVTVPLPKSHLIIEKEKNKLKLHCR